MDNDELLSRGQPNMLILLLMKRRPFNGDALQTFAFEILTQAPSLSAEQKLQLVKVLVKHLAYKACV